MPFYRHFFRTKCVSQTSQRCMKTIWTYLLFAVVTFWVTLLIPSIHRCECMMLPYERTMASRLRLASIQKCPKGVKIKQMRDRLCFFC